MLIQKTNRLDFKRQIESIKTRTSADPNRAKSIDNRNAANDTKVSGSPGTSNHYEGIDLDPPEDAHEREVLVIADSQDESELLQQCYMCILAGVLLLSFYIVLVIMFFLEVGYSFHMYLKLNVTCTRYSIVLVFNVDQIIAIGYQTQSQTRGTHLSAQESRLLVICRFCYQNSFVVFDQVPTTV